MSRSSAPAGRKTRAKTLTPESVRDMVHSGQWALRIPRQGPVGLSIIKQRRFDHRMQMVRMYINAKLSFEDLAQMSKKKGWSERGVSRQAMYFHLRAATKWLCDHGCLVKRET